MTPANGDIAVMLNLPEGQKLFPTQKVGISRVVGSDGSAWQPDPAAKILLLGDSFSNIYSLAEMGWGSSAGLAEQLSFELKQPVDTIIRNAGGAYATRRDLALDLARGIDRLANKKVVIWQFAMRELAVGDWRIIPLDQPPKTAATQFWCPSGGETVLVEGVVAEASPVPRPGTVPYTEHVRSIHVKNLRGIDVKIDGSEAVVYLQSMVKNVWTDAATIRTGHKVRLRLQPWSEKEAELGTLNRSELSDPELQFEIPCYGELIK